MNRLQLLVDHAANQALLDAAVTRFDRHGYAGTSVGDIAADAGVSRADFSAHFASKAMVLTEIAHATYESALARLTAALMTAGEDPGDRLEAAIWTHCDFAIGHRRALGVIDAELDRLPPADRERVIEARDRIAGLIAEIVADGALRGVFIVDRPAIISRALLGMCTAIAASYPDAAGGQAPRQLAETGCELALRMAGAPARGHGRRLVAVPQLQTA